MTPAEASRMGREALIMVLSWNQHPEATQPGAELL